MELNIKKDERKKLLAVAFDEGDEKALLTLSTRTVEESVDPLLDVQRFRLRERVYSQLQLCTPTRSPPATECALFFFFFFLTSRSFSKKFQDLPFFLFFRYGLAHDGEMDERSADDWRTRLTN